MTTGSVDLNGMLRDGVEGTTVHEGSGLAADPGHPQVLATAGTPARRHHCLDDNELSGFGRLAAEPRTQASRRSGEDYTVLRIAQNVRAVGSTVVTNYFDLVCFGGAHHIAKDLVLGQEVYFRGTFLQETLERMGQPTRLLNKVIVEYLRLVAKGRSAGTAVNQP